MKLKKGTTFTVNNREIVLRSDADFDIPHQGEDDLAVFLWNLGNNHQNFELNKGLCVHRYEHDGVSVKVDYGFNAVRSESIVEKATEDAKKEDANSSDEYELDDLLSMSRAELDKIAEKEFGLNPKDYSNIEKLSNAIIKAQK